MSQQAVNTSQTSLDYALAKAQYKQARKAAGKSYLPIAVGSGVVAAALVVGIVGSFAWGYFGEQYAPTGSDEVVTVVEESASNTSDVTKSAKAAAADAKADEAGPLGVWRGSCEETKSMNTGANYAISCFGGELGDMVFDVKNVTEAGRVEADIAVVYHGHRVTYKSPDAAASTVGDEVMTFTDVVGTYSKGKYAFEIEIKGQDEKIEIKAEPERDSMATLTATVTSTFEGKKYVRDTYELTKMGD